MITKRRHLLISIIVLIVFSASVTLIVVSVRYNNSYALNNIVNTDSVIGRLQSTFAAMNDFPGGVGKDMVFLRTISSLSNFYSNAPSSSLAPLRRDIQTFIRENKAYDEIVLYKKGCVLAIRRFNDIGSSLSCTSADSELQNVISHVNNLSAGGVFISRLINYKRIANGKLSTIPAILYGTKVSVTGSDGVLIAVINANYFLRDIRNLQRPGGKVFLLNIDGSYIANPDKTKEQLNGSTDNFYKDYSLIPKNILANVHVRQFETGKNVFTFMHIIPTTNNFELYTDASYEAKKQNNGSYWVMVSVSNKNSSGIWWLNESYLTDVGIILIMHFLVIVALYIAIFPTKELKEMFDVESSTKLRNK